MKILLTSPVKNYSPGFGESMLDIAKGRFTRGQEQYYSSSRGHYFALYLIAENINCDTTVLEHPLKKDFVKEIKKGYDYICIQLLTVYMDQTAEMVELVHTISPNSKIVIGGYGVSSLDVFIPNDLKKSAQTIKEKAHYFCREEGVSFMRKLLHDTPIDRPVTQYCLPDIITNFPGLRFYKYPSPILLIALGCPNRCNFCNTSAFFKGEKHYVLNAKEIYQHMIAYQERTKNKNVTFLFFDEDIFLNVELIKELGQLIRSDKNYWGLKWTAFGSVKSVSQFSPEELKSYGVDSIWIGVESFGENGFEKREGLEIVELFNNLHEHGIQIIGSLILGLDTQTKENIAKDINNFIRLQTTFYQVAPLTPCPGTEFYKQMVNEKRILENYRYEDSHIWSNKIFRYKNFTAEEIEDYYHLVHHKLGHKNGPSFFQMVRYSLNSYNTFKNSENEYLRFQAQNDAKQAQILIVYILVYKKNPYNKELLQTADQIINQYEKLLGKITIKSKIIASIISLLMKFERKQTVTDYPVIKKVSTRTD